MSGASATDAAGGVVDFATGMFRYPVHYLDFTIDYASGTLIFRDPISSQDASFNLVYIVAEYEVAGARASDELVAGGRAGYRFGPGDSGVGVTHVHDGTAGDGGELTGVDPTWELVPGDVFTVEGAVTDADADATSKAYRAQLEHRSGALMGRAYVREQQEDFGLGQPSVTETGTRKFRRRRRIPDQGRLARAPRCIPANQFGCEQRPPGRGIDASRICAAACSSMAGCVRSGKNAATPTCVAQSGAARRLRGQYE